MKQSTIFRFVFSSLVLFSTSSFAGIYLDNTRVIFQAADDVSGKSVGVVSSSSSQTPFLIKAQILKAPVGEEVGNQFIVSPSLFRLEPGSANQMRIMKKNSALPQDRESVFYLRTIATPAGEKNNEQQKKSIGGIIKVSSAKALRVASLTKRVKMPSPSRLMRQSTRAKPSLPIRQTLTTRRRNSATTCSNVRNPCCRAPKPKPL